MMFTVIYRTLLRDAQAHAANLAYTMPESISGFALAAANELQDLLDALDKYDKEG